MGRIILIRVLLVSLVCVALALGSDIPSLYAGSKTKEKGAQKSKAKGKEKKKGGKWVPPGLSKKEKTEWADGTPPGWSKGKKTGWGDSNVPPGFHKWEKNKQKKWESYLASAEKKAQDWIRERSYNQKMTDEQIDVEIKSVSLSVEETSRAGVPIDKVLEVVHKAIEKDMTGNEVERITRAVAYSTAKGAKVEEVVRYTEKALEGEIKGEDIALSIYRWFGKQLEEELKGEN